MLKYVWADQADQESKLFDSMLRDRADQFYYRHKWEALSLDEQGRERDEYDDLNPVYVICTDGNGEHAASVRLLPMSGPTMLTDHFDHIADLSGFDPENTIEGTRFCVSPTRGSRAASAAVVLGVLLFFQRLEFDYGLGIFTRRTARAYRVLGIDPTPLGSSYDGNEQLIVGSWRPRDIEWRRPLKRSGLTAKQCHACFDASLAGETSSSARSRASLIDLTDGAVARRQASALPSVRR